jgi:hypothetical protein
MVVVLQTRPQVPQFARLFWTSMQTPPQQRDPVGQLSQLGTGGV